MYTKKIDPYTHHRISMCEEAQESWQWGGRVVLYIFVFTPRPQHVELQAGGLGSP